MSADGDHHHPLFARGYAWAAGRTATDMARLRARLVAGLAGRVVEVGAGTGLSFPHYPPAVTEVLAVEPEPFLRRRAEAAARDAPVRVRVVDAVVESLPVADASVDAVVSSLVLCSVADQAVALAEVHRVLVPGGRLRFVEHVRARSRGLAWSQRLVDATVWPVLGAGCHTGRDTVSAIERAGLEVVELDSFRMPDTRVPLPPAPHVRGTAVRPVG